MYLEYIIIYVILHLKKKKLGNAGQTKINLTPAFRGRRRLGLDLTPIFLPSSSSIANLVALSPHWERIPTQNPFVKTRISPRCMSGRRVFLIGDGRPQLWLPQIQQPLHAIQKTNHRPVAKSFVVDYHHPHTLLTP